MMLNLGNFIADNVTHRAESMFAADIENNRETLSKEIEGKSLFSDRRSWVYRFIFYKSDAPFQAFQIGGGGFE